MIIPHHGAVLLDLINKTVQVALMTGAVPTAAITRDVFQDITDLRGQGIDRLELAGLALQKAGSSSIEAVASWISPLDSCV